MMTYAQLKASTTKAVWYVTVSKANPLRLKLDWGMKEGYTPTDSGEWVEDHVVVTRPIGNRLRETIYRLKDLFETEEEACVELIKRVKDIREAEVRRLSMLDARLARVEKYYRYVIENNNGAHSVKSNP